LPTCPKKRKERKVVFLIPTKLLPYFTVIFLQRAGSSKTEKRGRFLVRTGKRKFLRSGQKNLPSRLSTQPKKFVNIGI